MKKILFVLLATLLIASFAYAEQSAQTYSPNKLQIYREQQVFIDAYNGSGTDITSNAVVVIDTSTTNTASNSSLGTFISATTTANDPTVIGVTDAVIKNGSVGRVCVRGPHKCWLTAAPSAVGASLAATATSMAGGADTELTPGAVGVLGFALHTGVIVNSNSGFVAGDGTSNYWIWVLR